jgi:diguanylate cyclase (GGDEF)-like protein
MQYARNELRQWAPTLDTFWYVASMPLAIGAVTLAAHWGFKFPNVPPALLLPLAYSAYRGGLGIGLMAALLHVGYSAIFFSSAGGLFQYDTENLLRILVIAVVAPSMATMIGILRRKTDLSVRQLEAARNDLLRFTSELEKRVEERTFELAKMARHDSLTGVANRTALGEKLEQALARLHQQREPFTVFFLDIDGFKHINDTLGHAAGDLLLQEIAQRLTASLRETDFVARLGGDEFAIIQSGETDQREGAIALARKILNVVGKPMQLAGRDISIGTSIGIAVAPGDGTDAGVLLQRADLALYRVKAEGRNNFCFFDIEMSKASDERLQMVSDMREALIRGEFEVYYQPVFDAKTCRACGAEALVRWHHPVQGLIPPDRFIPLAEETGLMEPLGQWVLEQACRDATAWPDHVKIAVNLSTVQLRTSALFDVILHALRQSGLRPERLELEITETVLMQDVTRNGVIFRKLKNTGISIVLDDFGMGYSSLSYLTMLPFDKIKIDKSFTHGLTNNIGCMASVASVLTLARHLDMVVTAEGVETKQQFDLLRAAGVHQVQGYFFARPGPVCELDFASLDVKGQAVAAA